MTDREVKIRATLDVKQAQANFDKFTLNLGKGLKGAATASKLNAGVMNETLGRSLASANEKTEKFRWALTAMGGQLGSVAGTAAYTAGNFAYMAGKFKVWEFAAMGGIGALAILGTKLYEVTSGPIKEFREEIKGITTDLDNMTEALYSTATKSLVSALGMNAQMFEAAHKISEIQTKLAETQAKRADLIKSGMSWYVGGESPVEEIDREIEALKARLAMAQSGLASMGVSETVKGSMKGGKAGGGGGGGKKDSGAVAAGPGTWNVAGRLGAWGAGFAGNMEEQLAADAERYSQQWYSAKQRAFDAARELEWQYYEDSNQMAEENAARREHFMQQEADARESLIENSISLVGALSMAMADGSKAQTALQIAEIMLLAAWNASKEIAAGIATSIANPIESASHFAAAAVYGAMAAGKIAGAVGGGGGGRRERASRQSNTANEWQERSSQKKEMTIIVKLGGDEAGRAIVRAIDEYQGKRVT